MMIHHDTESRLLLARERADLLAHEWVPAKLVAAVYMRGGGSRLLRLGKGKPANVVLPAR